MSPDLGAVTSVTRELASGERGEVKRLPPPGPGVTAVSPSVLLVAAPLVCFSVILNLKETTLNFYLNI